MRPSSNYGLKLGNPNRARNAVVTPCTCRTTLTRMDDDIPVVVRMCVECARCSHAEDDTYEFDMPHDDAEPMEEYVRGTCPKCGAAIHMHLKRTRRRQ